MPTFIVGPASNYVTLIGTTALPADAWSHIAVARSATTGKLALYVDTVKIVEVDFAIAMTDTANDMKIGAGFDGQLDEVRLSKVDRGSELLAVDVEYVYNNANQLIEDYTTSKGMISETNIYSYDADGSKAKREGRPTGAAGEAGNRTQVDTVLRNPDAALVDSTDLDAQWSFDGDTATDLAANGNDGTVSGGAAWIDTDIGRAVVLDGIDDKIVKTLTSSTKTAFTVALWARTDQLTQDLYTGIFASHDASGVGFQIDFDGSGNYRLRKSSGTSVLIGPAADRWIQLTVVCNGTDTKAYYDGTLAGTIAMTSSLFSQYSIGCNRTAGKFFEGMVGNLRVYDRALTASEVTDLKESRAVVMTRKTMDYDIFNRMTEWKEETPDGTGGWAFVKSEATGYRGDKWQRCATVSDAGMTSYLYDGDNVIADIVDGSVVRSYVTPMLDSNVSMTVHDGVDNPVYYYNQDERQSVMNLTDDTGVIVQDYAYSAYGDKLRSQVSTLIPNRYQFTGRELSDTTGDFYFRYRWYSAGTGSFLTRDPLEYVDGSSMYAGWFSGRLATDPMGLEIIYIVFEQYVMDMGAVKFDDPRKQKRWGMYLLKNFVKRHNLRPKMPKDLNVKMHVVKSGKEAAKLVERVGKKGDHIVIQGHTRMAVLGNVLWQFIRTEHDPPKMTPVIPIPKKSEGLGVLYSAIVKMEASSLTLSICKTEKETANKIFKDLLKSKVTLYYTDTIHERKRGDFGVDKDQSFNPPLTDENIEVIPVEKK